MLKNALGLSLVVGILGCAAPQRAGTPAISDSGSVGKEVAQLKETLARLDNRLGHLESEVAAASAENELTEMTIDKVLWADETVTPGLSQGKPTLLGHVKEWRGFGKMLRFTRQADQNFILEADGHPPVFANTGEGGRCSADGSTRYVMFWLDGDLVPNATYHMRPQNGKEKYRWSVPADLVVVAFDAKR